MRTTVHTSSEYRARQAVFAGIDTLTHPVMQEPVTDDFAQLMGARKIPMVTTLTIGENYSRRHSGGGHRSDYRPGRAFDKNCELVMAR